jgi:hypothetical protein
LYLVRTQFEYRSGHRYPEVFRGSPQSIQANSGIILLLGQYNFLPNPSQFITHPSIRRRTF